MTAPDDTAAWRAFNQLINARSSIRGYLPKPVERPLIEEILSLAAHSPSGTNTQPWRVHVLTGDALRRVVQAVCAAYDAEPGRCDTVIYPNLDREPYLSRKRALGKAMYSLMGIGKGDAAAMLAQRRRNFEFFGAPVGLFVTIDKQLGYGSWMDSGMFMQSLMLAAKAKGLDTCPQGFWVHYESIIAQAVGWSDNERLVSGIALGYADPAVPENTLRSERATLAEFAVIHE
jgi:nitroreductase